MRYHLQYEWHNPPHWHAGSFDIAGLGSEEREEGLLAKAFLDALSEHPRFRNVRLLVEETKFREIT